MSNRLLNIEGEITISTNFNQANATESEIILIAASDQTELVLLPGVCSNLSVVLLGGVQTQLDSEQTASSLFLKGS